MPKQTTKESNLEKSLTALKLKKNELETKKKELGGDWTPDQQAELEKVISDMVDMEEAIEAQEKPSAEKEQEQPKKVETKYPKDKIVLRLIKGKRYDSSTGELISTPFDQTFTFSEWNNFKLAYRGLGYQILEVLNDPFNVVNK